MRAHLNERIVDFFGQIPLNDHHSSSSSPPSPPLSSSGSLSPAKFISLTKLTQGGELAEKVAVYNLANKEVAIICNHQRSVSKSHSVQISKLNEKIDELKALLQEFKVDLAQAKKGEPPLKGADGKAKRNLAPEALQKKIDQTNVK
ncbi:PREDICTED: DNA topoisomerase 1 beta-like [Nicotiana attenuata]|uniref:DNA topoisomerase 1 beta-like n=1 Tax=Nicotiana attenuata TaxID=49451 RepID=UPI000905813D|nr:PREDICTED: DNA topoisomerase 1 beta-like [Nicotiana attenuata]